MGRPLRRPRVLVERSEFGAFEWAVIAFGVLVALPVFLFWSAARLAAALAGHHLEASFEEAFSALGRLKGHVGDPASAWPGGGGEALPGPLLSWVCTAAVFVLALGVLVVAARWWGWSGVGTEPRAPLGVDARARFATVGALAPLLVRGPRTGRFVLGRVGGRLVATEAPTDRRARSRRRRVPSSADYGALALIGPSRCGKTAATVGGILEWDGPAVLSSVKADLLAVTQGWRSRLGDVRVYDPTGTTGEPCAGWSPLRDAGSVLGAQRAAKALCEAVPGAGGVENLDFWLAKSETLLAGLLYVAHHAGRDMATVRDWVMTQDRPGDHGPGEVKAALDVLLASPDDTTAEGAADAATWLLATWGLEERTRASVYATAQTLVWPWSDPGVALASMGESVDLDWLVSGPNTLYLCAPIEDRQRLAPAFGGLLNDVIRQVCLRHEATKRALDPPLLLVIDEAGNTPIQNLPEYASTLAGLGVVLVTVWQSVAQMEAAYRRHADGLLTNHRTKLFYAGISDPASLRYVSQVLGDAEVDTRSHTVATGRSGSWQVATSRVPLVPPHALRQMRAGDALLLHGTLPPAHLSTRPYYLDADLAAKAALAASCPPDPAPSGAGPIERGTA